MIGIHVLNEKDNAYNDVNNSEITKEEKEFKVKYLDKMLQNENDTDNSNNGININNDNTKLNNFFNKQNDSLSSQFSTFKQKEKLRYFFEGVKTTGILALHFGALFLIKQVSNIISPDL